MEEALLQTVAQVGAFLEGTTDVFPRIRKEERYGFIGRTLKRLGNDNALALNNARRKLFQAISAASKKRA